MPPFLAIFMSVDGVPLQTGLFTEAEFQARIDAAQERTKWAILVDTSDGKTIAHFVNRPKTNEKTI